MKQTFYIQNMVCDRCKTAVEHLIKKNHAEIISLELGRVIINTSPAFTINKFSEDLKDNGFRLIKNPDIKITETIKVNLLDLLNAKGGHKHFSTYLENKLHRDYSVLSKTFKKIEGRTIEKYFINLKIEKVKELIQMQNLSFTEIAYHLDYNSISHLSGQFKNVTGMTMSEYADSQDWNRRAYDEIV